MDSGLPQLANALPGLSALCQQSVLFTNVYAPCPESGPARASLFTGLDPAVHGVWTNGVALPAVEQTFAQTLAQAGYSNWLVGRRQLAGVSRWTTESSRPDEYQHLDWAHGPLHRSRQNAYINWLRQRSPAHYNQLFPTQANPDDTRVQAVQRKVLAELDDDLSFNDWVGNRLVERMSTHPTDRPFFAVAGFSVGQSFGTEPCGNSDGEALCKKALKQADAALTTILKELAASHRADDTVVFVTSARGNQIAETTLNAAETPIMSERSIRVPLLIRHPAHESHTDLSLVSTTDIAPTILDTAGIEPGPRIHGRSLFDLMNGTAKPRNWAMSRFRRLPADGTRREWQTALRVQAMKLIVNHGIPQEDIAATYSLYDLDADPLEQNDLANLPAKSAVVEDMIDLMIDARCALEDRTEPRIAEF